MILGLVGCSYRTAPVELRERLAFDSGRLEAALAEISARYGCEVVILSTCNRVELYLARLSGPGRFDIELFTEFLAEFHQVRVAELRPHMYEHHQHDAVRHLFRVVAGLDSMILGEGQIAGQVKRAYEVAQKLATVGPLLHTLFQHARFVAKRVRSETGIAQGHISVSAAAVDYVRQVFDHFDDKIVLVIGAGKMGEMTLRHLRLLKPQQIWVTNRSPEKAEAVARGCGGIPIPWEKLDDALVQADIVLSTTGASEPIVTLERYRPICDRRSRTLVVLDIAVPRDFDPRIHDGDRTCLFNIDDLKHIREQTLHERLRHVPAAESIVEHEQRRYWKEWARKRHGPIIARLTQDFESKRQAVERQLYQRLKHLLNGQLTETVWAEIRGALRLYQNQCLHGPISALAEEGPGTSQHTLLEALRKLFRLHE
ncbi:MAG: glutamyl-tRNA reductase [Gemmataceae bacterium]|nr:glutamyl-tRNA reductase [Gemmataceae bacterium]MDW8265638.1 glutamyl-tRNA reductase [Gemmataceae bacterium]